MDNSNPASLRLLLIGAAAAAGAYGAYRFRSASRPDGKRRQADAAQVARWRAQLFASKHWAPIVEYAARFGVALQPPPPTKDDEPKLPSEPYNWAFVARALNFLNNTLPYSVLDSSFLHKQELLDMIDAALLDTPAVDCLGGQRANQLIHDRFYRW